MSIQNVKLKNFTVFESIDIDVARGINVIIGENGTGKTHLMKAMYVGSGTAVLANREMNDFSEYFKIENSELMRDKQKDSSVVFMGIEGTNFRNTIFPNNSVERNVMGNTSLENHRTFIPAKDMLTHSKGFISWYDERNIPFDKTYRDIVGKSLLSNLREIPTLGKSVIPKLEKLIGGQVVVENDTFFIKKTNGRKVEFSVEAEGIKKIAVIWQLIMNEGITKDTVLFWDEPESNINPSLVSDVIEILLELSRQGVQIFLATHDYVFAKYIEVLMQESDDVAFHALYKTESEGVGCESKSKFTYLENNSIVKEKIALYKEEVKRAME